MDTLTATELSSLNRPAPALGRARRRANGVSKKSTTGSNGGRRVSMRQVAEAAEVSIATVSLVLNENPRISQATADKVMRVMDELGYVPARQTPSAAASFTNTLAVLVPPLRHAYTDPYFGELLSGICDRANRLGQKIMLEQAKPDFIREGRHLDLFNRRQADGVLCLGFNDRHAFVREFQERGVPAMLVNNYADSGLDYVVADYRMGAEQAMNFLFQLGHHRIGLIHGTVEARTMRDVVETYRRTMGGVGQSVDASWQADGRFTEEGGAEAAGKLIDAHADMTAIFAANDKMALGALHALHGRDIPVPERMSVMGFDDIQGMAFVQPSLSSVHLPLYEVGTMACERLVQRVRGGDQRVEQVLPTHLVLRDSTAIVPRGHRAS